MYGSLKNVIKGNYCEYEPEGMLIKAAAGKKRAVPRERQFVSAKCLAGHF